MKPAEVSAAERANSRLPKHDSLAVVTSRDIYTDAGLTNSPSCMFVVLRRCDRARVRSDCLPSQFTICYFKHGWSVNCGACRWVGSPRGEKSICLFVAERLVRAKDASDCAREAVGLTAFRNYGHGASRTPAVWSPCSCAVAALQLRKQWMRGGGKKRAIMVFESQRVSSGAAG